MTASAFEVSEWRVFEERDELFVGSENRIVLTARDPRRETREGEG
jgi:hypothetical protein